MNCLWDALCHRMTNHPHCHRLRTFNAIGVTRSVHVPMTTLLPSNVISDQVEKSCFYVIAAWEKQVTMT